MRKRLTTEGIAKLQGGNKRREIADDGKAGLYLVVQPSGSKSWALRYRYGRRPRKLTLGNYPAVDLLKARSRAQAAFDALDRGEDPAVAALASKTLQHAPSADRDSFGVLIRQFFYEHVIPHTRSWRETARLLGLAIDPVTSRTDGLPTFRDVPGRIVAGWAERPVPALRRRDVREVMEASRTRGASTTANRELAALKTFFNWAVDREVIEVSPTVRFAKPSVEKKRTRTLAPAELRLIWLAAEGQGYPFGDIIRLLVLTGQRRGEVAGAAWSEFDLKAKTWTLPPVRTKNGLPHLIPLSDAALDVLDNIPRFAEGEFLFGLGGRTGFTGYSKAKARLDGAVGRLAEGDMPEWNVHDLRRTAATGMAQIGVLPHVVEAVLNHISGAKAGVAGIYNLWSYEPEKRAALARWAEHVARIVDPDAAEVANVVPMKRGE